MGKSICVFCGSSFGSKNIFRKTAELFAGEIAKNDLTLVYGGGKVGIMGVISDAVICGGGKVVGVIPKFLEEKNLGNKKITELKIVNDMHARKAAMYGLSDYFVALPGGIGTLEEITEILTWKQLFLHAKPCALLNIDGYFDDLIKFLRKSVKDGFMKQNNLDNMIVEPDYRKIIERLRNYVSTQEPKF